MCCPRTCLHVFFARRMTGTAESGAPAVALRYDFATKLVYQRVMSPSAEPAAAGTTEGGAGKRGGSRGGRANKQMAAGVSNQGNQSEAESYTDTPPLGNRKLKAVYGSGGLRAL